MTTKTKSPPKTVWAVAGNGYGLRGPFKCSLASPEFPDDTPDWRNESADEVVEALGLVWSPDGETFTFSSPVETDVTRFLDGWAACAQITENATRFR